MTSPTGKTVKRPKPEEWSFQIEIRFVQVPDEKREAYWRTLQWLAEEIEKEIEKSLTAPRGKESGQ